jgi:hypothetical protein
MAQRFGTPEGGALRVVHDLTQDEIARLTGASREAVNKALVNGFRAGPFDSRLAGNLRPDADLRPQVTNHQRVSAAGK